MLVVCLFSSEFNDCIVLSHLLLHIWISNLTCHEFCPWHVPLTSTSCAPPAYCGQSCRMAQLCFHVFCCTAIVSRNHTCDLKSINCEKKSLFCRAVHLNKWNRCQVEMKQRSPQAVWVVWPHVAGARFHMQGPWQSWENDPALWVPVSLAHLLNQPVSQSIR